MVHFPKHLNIILEQTKTGLKCTKNMIISLIKSTQQKCDSKRTYLYLFLQTNPSDPRQRDMQIDHQTGMTDKTPIKLSYHATDLTGQLQARNYFSPIMGVCEQTHLDNPEGRLKWNESKWHPLLLRDFFSLVNYRFGVKMYTEQQQFTSSPLMTILLVIIVQIACCMATVFLPHTSC